MSLLPVNSRDNLKPYRVIPFAGPSSGESLIDVTENLRGTRPAELSGLRILIVGNEQPLLDLMTAVLTRAGAETMAYEDEASAREALSDWRPALIMVEAGAPHEASLRLCRSMAQTGVPTLPMVHGVDRDEMLIVLGEYAELSDDYFLCYPCSPGEKSFCSSCLFTNLVPRILTLLQRKRHPRGSDSDVIAVGNLRIDLGEHRVSRADVEVRLTRTEVQLLKYLMANVGRSITRDELLREVWGYEYAGGSNVVDVTIRNLRRKIEADPQRPQIIVTSHGIGYRLTTSNA